MISLETPTDKINKNKLNINKRSNTYNSLIKELKIDTKDIVNKTQKNQEQTLISEKNIQPKEHPLEFYALGKVNNYRINNISFPLYKSQGFRNSSNDMIKRNIFSIKSSCYDELRRKKEYSTIKNKILEEDNYLNPLKIYNSFHKYDVQNNCINKETYNLAKEKFYSRDRFSNIKKGFLLSTKDFKEQKIKLINKSCKSIELKEKRPKLSFENNNNLDKNKNEKICKTLNNYFFKDPNDNSKEKLKSKEWKFDRNYKKFIKHKNWWNSDM